jgi:hypothetical protein
MATKFKESLDPVGCPAGAYPPSLPLFLEVLILKGLRFLISPPESTLLGNSEVLILKGLRCLTSPPESTLLGSSGICNRCRKWRGWWSARRMGAVGEPADGAAAVTARSRITQRRGEPRDPRRSLCRSSGRQASGDEFCAELMREVSTDDYSASMGIYRLAFECVWIFFRTL